MVGGAAGAAVSGAGADAETLDNTEGGSVAIAAAGVAASAAGPGLRGCTSMAVLLATGADAAAAAVDEAPQPCSASDVHSAFYSLNATCCQTAQHAQPSHHCLARLLLVFVAVGGYSWKEQPISCAQNDVVKRMNRCVAFLVSNGVSRMKWCHL